MVMAWAREDLEEMGRLSFEYVVWKRNSTKSLWLQRAKRESSR